MDTPLALIYVLLSPKTPVACSRQTNPRLILSPRGPPTFYSTGNRPGPLVLGSRRLKKIRKAYAPPQKDRSLSPGTIETPEISLTSKNPIAVFFIFVFALSIST